MAYIVFVNPSILHETGMPFQAVVAATCFCAAFGSISMGAFARYPIALAPGMGLNAYFTYVVVKGMGIAWQTALGAVFVWDRVSAPDISWNPPVDYGSYSTGALCGGYCGHRFVHRDDRAAQRWNYRVELGHLGYVGQIERQEYATGAVWTYRRLRAGGMGRARGDVDRYSDCDAGGRGAGSVRLCTSGCSKSFSCFCSSICSTTSAR